MNEKLAPMTTERTLGTFRAAIANVIMIQFTGYYINSMAITATVAMMIMVALFMMLTFNAGL